MNLAEPATCSAPPRNAQQDCGKRSAETRTELADRDQATADEHHDGHRNPINRGTQTAMPRPERGLCPLAPYVNSFRCL